MIAVAVHHHTLQFTTTNAADNAFGFVCVYVCLCVCLYVLFMLLTFESLHLETLFWYADTSVE